MATPARPRIDTGYFFQQIAQAKRCALVLDYDTTLRSGEIPQPFAMAIPTVRELLDCIVMARRTRVIVATADHARKVLAALAAPYPEIWGRNGRERVSAVAANAAAGYALCLEPRRQAPILCTLLGELSAAGPVAYLKGETRSSVPSGPLLIRPEFHLSPNEMSLGGKEGLVQFLVDWLRARAGEIC